VELPEAMRTQNACRYYRDDPVPDEVLYRAVELARFAPNGGNRCAVRFVFVRDPALRRQLGEWYLPLRAQGVGTALTTLLVAREPEVKELLGIPGHFSTACHITAGYPVRPFPRKLHRPEVADLAFTDTFGVPLSSPDA
jgi:nitroreductase